MALAALDRTLDGVLARRGRSYDGEVIAALFDRQIPALVLQRIDRYAMYRAVFGPLLAFLRDNVELNYLPSLDSNDRFLLSRHLESVVITGDNLHRLRSLRPGHAYHQEKSHDCK